MFRYLKLGDPVVLCPYNKSHVIARSRLQKHIVKCEKQYPEHYKVMCPYNATHRLHKSEIEEHIVTCPTRIVLESVMHTEVRNHGCTNFPVPSDISSTVDCTENWDSDIDSNSIVPDNEFTSNDNLVLPKLEYNISEREDLRPPRGYCEAMMREVNEDSALEDAESVYSSSGVGRGRIIREVQMKLRRRGGANSLKRD
ncbi:uncharacterized protein LOC143214070 [Lasioglossum baleicum]|uniref:uncharacterized protein LOC143214070 n=1 Tax=Lasioglossum baleicum TaxID=434251 RepID=UPI003FCE1B83